MRPRGRGSENSLFCDLQMEVVGDGGDGLDLLGVAAGLWPSGWSMSFAWVGALWLKHCFCVSRLSHGFIMVEMTEGVVFQDL